MRFERADFLQAHLGRTALLAPCIVARRVEPEPETQRIGISDVFVNRLDINLCRGFPGRDSYRMAV